MGERSPLLGAGERAWLDRLILPLPRGASILDLGCGGGEPIDRYLIDHGFHVTGVDISATMIDLARTRFPRERWLCADIRTVALDDSFAAIVAWNSLPQAEPDAMAARLMTWLRPGGRLLLGGGPAADIVGELSRRGMVGMAHADHDASCDGAAVSLLRKP